MTRPYKCDPYLDEIMDDFVVEKTSMCQKIQHSSALKDIFAEEVLLNANTATAVKKVENLRAAKHRFESLATPLGRILLHLQAFVSACQRIADVRTGDSAGVAARAFLDHLTAERLIQVGLLSDGMDECMMLIRSVDKENVDVSLIPLEVQGFVDHLQALFGPDRCALKTPGFAKHVADLLSPTSGISYMLGGKVHHIKLPTEIRPMMDRVFRRMGCWMNLVLEVLRTEWPDYTLLASMGIFGLAETSTCSTAAESFKLEADVCIRRLAKVFDVNADGLKAELERLRPVAARSLS
jgi:hypothetical protein